MVQQQVAVLAEQVQVQVQVPQQAQARAQARAQASVWVLADWGLQVSQQALWPQRLWLAL